MAKFKTTKAARDAAVARILARPPSEREQASKDEARKLRVAVRYMRRIVTETERRRGPFPFQRDGTDPVDGVSEPEESAGLFESAPSGPRDPSPDLERARKSAGIDEEPEGTTPESGGGASESIPAPSPKVVVSMASYVRLQTMKIYAGVLRLDLQDAEVRAALEMGQEEKDALEGFAPYLANYFPELLGDDSKAGAIAFCAIFALGSWNSMSDLRAMKKEREDRRQRPIINVEAVPDNGAEGIPRTAQGPSRLESIGY